MPAINLDISTDTMTGLTTIANTLQIEVEDLAEIAVEVFLSLYADRQLEISTTPEYLN